MERVGSIVEELTKMDEEYDDCHKNFEVFHIININGRQKLRNLWPNWRLLELEDSVQVNS